MWTHLLSSWLEIRSLHLRSAIHPRINLDLCRQERKTDLKLPRASCVTPADVPQMCMMLHLRRLTSVLVSRREKR